MHHRVYENKLKKDLYRTNDTAAKNLRFLRLLHGYKQCELADILGVGRGVYLSIENGRKQMDFDILCFFSDFYEVDINYLVSVDMCDQIMTMIRADQERLRADVFLDRYFSLSRNGREQIRAEILGLSDHEKRFKRFPWKYEGFEDLVTVDTLYEKGFLYEERERKKKRK